MNIDSSARSGEPRSLRKQVFERMRIVLRRLGPILSLVHARFSIPMGAHSSVDKNAHIRLDLLSDGTVVVESKTQSWLAVLKAALQRSIARVLSTDMQVRTPQHKLSKNLIPMST